MKNKTRDMKRISLFILLGIFILLCFSMATVSLIILKDLPDISQVKNYKPLETTIVFDRNMKQIGKFFDERRTVVDVKSLPSFVVDAFVAAEDSAFFEHGGIDINGLLRAISSEIKYRLLKTSRSGGSTITQQVARNILLSHKQSYFRKIREIVLARKIEKNLTKDEILHLYLNQIYFGHGAYGIEEASQTYFEKGAEKIDLFEATILASIPKSPNRINPFNDVVRLKQRQNYVLNRMSALGYISNETKEELVNKKIYAYRSNKSNSHSADYFLKEVQTFAKNNAGISDISFGGFKVFTTLDLDLQNIAENSLSKGLKTIDDQFGYKGPCGKISKEDEISLLNWKKDHGSLKNMTWDLSLFLSQKKIYLAKEMTEKKIGALVLNVDKKGHFVLVDLGFKKVKLFSKSWSHYKIKDIRKVLAKGDIILLSYNRSNSNASYTLSQDININGALIALDVESGGILALSGGYSFDQSNFNRATSAKRQPGSSIKPFIYAKAIDMELITPATIISDVPKAFYDPGQKDYWKPKNHTRKYLGDITVRRCLSSSVNTCTISILEKIGISNFKTLAANIGLHTKETPYSDNFTIALGSSENIPIQLANAYRIFPLLGNFSEFHFVDKITGDKDVLYEQKVKEATRVLKEQTAFIATNLLSNIISDDLKKKYLPDVKVKVFGKTGTTNDARSVWFAGFSKKIVALVYVGFDDNRSMGKNFWAISKAFPIWASFMNEALKGEEEDNFYEPDGIVWLPIDQKDGKAKSFKQAFMNQEHNIILEPFMSGTEPTINEHANDTKNLPLNIRTNAAFAP